MAFSDYREPWIVLRMTIVVQTLILALVPPGASGSWIAQLAWFFFVLIVLLSLKPAYLPIKGLAGAIVVAALLMLAQLVTVGDRTSESLVFEFPTVGRVVVSRLAIRSGAVLAVKVLAVFLSAQLLLSASMGAVAAALARLGAPRLIIAGLVLGQRALVVVEAQWASILEAHRLRGVDIDRQNIGQRLFRTYPTIVVPLIISLLRRNLQMEISLVMRRFYEPVKRTSLYEISMSRGEKVLIACSALMWLSLLALNLGIQPSLR